MSMEEVNVSRVDQLQTVQNEALELFRKKNADYGDAFATYGTVGILVRLGDKIHRLQSITSKGINLVEDERLRDTLIDLHNYAAMGIMLLDSDDTKSSPAAEDIPQPVSLLSPKQNICLENWNVTGSSGNEYVMKRFKNSSGGWVITCSCPSYEFSNFTCKTCKHVKEYLKK